MLRRVHGLGTTMWIGALALAALLVATWVVSMRLRDASVVDVVWGVAFVLVGWIAVGAGEGDGTRSVVAAALASAWGLRLAAHIARRKRGEADEDRRYAQMRERHGSSFAVRSLGSVFLAQAAIAWVVSLPLQAAGAGDRGFGALDAIGIALWAVGLAFEAIGDAQLERFKADPGSRGQVMDRGLWRYTRHPNYFGDACVWWGLGLIGLAAGGWWALAGPVVMTVLLLRVSGAALLERDIGDRRPGYRDYVERTSGFVPLPPRRAGSSR